MEKRKFTSVMDEGEEKASYNQAGEITRILAMLRLTYTSAMIEQPNDFSQALESCRGVLNIIAGKVKEERVDELNEIIYELEDRLPDAEETFESEGNKYFAKPSKRKELKREIENLWRMIEKTQDEYGYGMLSQEDYGL